MLYIGSGALPALKQWVKSKPLLASFAFDIWNANYFGRLQIHEKMLADRMRVENYYEAISKHVRPGDVVVDLGTGTGILAFFAALKKPTKVYAIEHSRMVEIATRLANENHLDNVEFCNCNSKDFKIREKADVIIHEQIGSAIFNENMIENVTDLRDRILKEGGKILPNRFEVFLEPVQLKEEFRVPFAYEMKLHGISFESLKSQDTYSSKNGKLLQPKKWRFTRSFEIERLICEPKPIMQFDLETITNEYKPTRVEYRNAAIGDGRVDGLLLYFNAIFDDEIKIDTNPMNAETSWLPSLLRLERQDVVHGTPVNYDLEMDDVKDYQAWRLNWRTASPSKNNHLAEVI